MPVNVVTHPSAAARRWHKPFIAKAEFRLGRTKQLRERLLADRALRRLLGFDSSYKLLSQSSLRNPINSVLMRVSNVL